MGCSIVYPIFGFRQILEHQDKKETEAQLRTSAYKEAQPIALSCASYHFTIAGKRRYGILGSTLCGKQKHPDATMSL